MKKFYINYHYENKFLLYVYHILYIPKISRQYIKPLPVLSNKNDCTRQLQSNFMLNVTLKKSK